MKRIQLSLISFLFSTILYTQTGFNYKAIIKDDLGNIVDNKSIEVIFQVQQLDDTIYEELHTPTTDNNGIIVVYIGEGNPIDGNFTDLQWEEDEHFLNVQVNIGEGFKDLGTTQFRPVPYAIIAEKSMSSNESQTNAIVISPEFSALNYSDFTLLGDGRVVIIIDFNIQMDPSTFVNGSNFILSGNIGTATGTFTWSNGNTRLRFQTNETFLELAQCFTGGIQLLIRGNGTNPVEDSLGKPIDGDRNGKVRGDFVTNFDIVC